MNFDVLFAALDQRPVEEIKDISGLAGTIHMRPLSVAEREALNKEVYGDKLDRTNVPSSVSGSHSLAAVLCEPDGSRLSADDKARLVAKIPSGSTVLFDRLIARANAICGLGPNAVEDAEKNSVTTESGDSATS